MDKKIVNRLWAAGLALAAVFGGMGCLTSGFDLGPVGLWTALSWVLAAVVFSVCLPGKLVLYPLGGLVLLALGLWRHGELSRSMELLLREISTVYHRAYGWGVIGWSEAADPEAGIGTALCWLGLPIVLLTCNAVLRRGWITPAVLAACLPLGCCMVVTDKVPGALPLGLLLFTVALLTLTQMVRRRDGAQGNRLLLLLSLPLALALTGLFLAFPQEGRDYQESARKIEDWVLDRFQGSFGFTQPTLTPQSTHPDPTAPYRPVVKRENLELVGPKVQSDMRVLTVLSTQGGALYLRGTGFDSYSGREWTTRGSELPELWPEDSLLTEAGEVKIDTFLYQDTMYVPYYAGKDIYSRLDQGVVGNESGSRSYSFPRVGSLPAGALTPQGEYTPADGAWLALPEQTLDWAKPLIRELFGTDTPPATLATVQRVADHVRGSARYDLDTPRMDEGYGDFARWFLEESDTGYCIHFATATAVLLRAAGIPSRYVTGYMVTARAGEAVTATGKHAHAWVEFRLPGCCWYPLESTPAQAGEGPMPTLPSVTEPEETQWQQATVSPETTWEASQPTQPRETHPTQTAPEAPEGERFRLPPWLTVTALLAAAAVLQWRLRVRLHAGMGRRGKSKRKALERWQQHALMARLLGESPDRELLELAQRAKFSQHPITAEELARFTQTTRRQTARLQKKPWYLQLYYTLILALY